MILPEKATIQRLKVLDPSFEKIYADAVKRGAEPSPRSPRTFTNCSDDDRSKARHRFSVSENPWVLGEARTSTFNRTPQKTFLSFATF